MLENFLVVILVILAIIMITVILLQPDRSQGLAKNTNVLDEEKEGVEKFTEWIAAAFLITAVVFQIVR
ncbi:MAG: preprotein translocase subunit SecG [Leptotrichiaceae bacterium]|nr:preprotein translocase subunit SecG [Leptotrichiaceae bacterium]MBP9630470.1 preprotein translocase subunit SecG [Leptotrichiaceae bacterium]